MNKFFYIVSLTTILLIPTSIYAEPHCGDLETRFGPLDYNIHKGKRVSVLQVVEKNHFTKNVETLVSGNTSTIGGDISFVLNTFPNHHRALLAMSKLAIRDKTNKPKAASYSVLCYFDRAIRFTDDYLVYSIYSNYLLKIGKIDMALQQLFIAEKLNPEDPTISYNLGLLYFKKKEYDKANEHAKKAYSFGFPLPGLRNKLKKVGRWEK